jgi:hypothetical protein
MKNKLFLTLMVAALTACASKEDVVEMTIASEKRLAMAGITPMEVLLVKEGAATQWSFFYSPIEGFDHEPGYEYVVMVRRENIEGVVPADASSIRYTFVELVSRTRKTSDNMPRDLVEIE